MPWKWHLPEVFTSTFLGPNGYELAQNLKYHFYATFLCVWIYRNFISNGCEYETFNNIYVLSFEITSNYLNFLGLLKLEIQDLHLLISFESDNRKKQEIYKNNIFLQILMCFGYIIFFVRWWKGWKILYISLKYTRQIESFLSAGKSLRFLLIKL